MTPERWAQVEELFHRAMECEPGERIAILEEAGAADPELRREVEGLLSSQAGAGTHLRGVVLGSAASADAGTESAGGPATATRTEDVGASPEEAIGPYHLLQLIGEGGMGEVWLAEQRQPVRRRVALKLIKAGMDTREIVARFESERQALALMDHPAIAKVFDAGSTPQRTPYFAMEYVAGLAITTYCDRHKLDIRERLELFMRVCEGVQHAHQKAIIHRDLKPSNVLVTEVDGHPAPKIIDFGIAKAVGQKLTADTLFTRVGAMIGTPEYMSPEQALSSGEDIDTRADVYSLGVILYELLAGAPPLDLRKITLDELLRRLREDEPAKPSARIRARDGAAAPALAKQIRGDLDSIALKALEKDRSRRYGSPAELAADIERYLKNEAVLAMAPSAGYRARKFARRHRAGLITAGAFALVLIAAAGISIREGIRASREAAVAQAVNDFLQNDLLAQASAATQAGPGAKPDPHLEVRTALDRAAARIGGKFQRQPEVEAAIRDTMGQTYIDLGTYAEARKQLEQALELYRRAEGPKNPKTLKVLSRLGRIAALDGRGPQAETLFNEALALQRRVLGPEHPDTLYSLSALAVVYSDQGKYAQAEALFNQALEIQSRVLGPQNRDTLFSMNNLADVYGREGNWAQAEKLCSKVLEIRRRVLGPEHPETLQSMSNLAMAYDSEAKYAQAEDIDYQLLTAERRVLGPEHLTTLSVMNNLALVYDQEGKYAQAEALDDQTLEIMRHVLGPEHPATLGCMENLARVYGEQGKSAQAEALFTRTLTIERRTLGADHPDTLDTQAELASMYQREGKYASAEKDAAQILAGRRRALGSKHPDTMASAADLALAYISQKKFAQSEPLAQEALAFNRAEQPDDWQRFRAESLLGASLAGQKEYAQAEPLLLEGYRGMLARKDRIEALNLYHLDRAREWLVNLYQAWGKPEKSGEWKKK